MALIGFEGFDHYGVVGDLLLRSGALQLVPYNNVGDLVTYSPFLLITPGRGGYGKCLQVVSAAFGINYFTVSIASNLTTGYFGAALKLSPGTGYVIALRDPLAVNPIQITVYFDTTSGTVSLYPGPYAFADALYNNVPRLAVSANNVINTTVWNFVEIGAHIATSGGSITVQVNGQTVISFTGTTQISAEASFGAVSFCPIGVANNYGGVLQIDDLRVNDTSVGAGPFPCDGFLGDLRVATLFPDGDLSVGWTPAAASNWVEVSETAFDGDASYNFAPGVGAADLFSMTALNGLIAYIVSMQITGAYRQTDSSAHTVAQQLETNGSTYTSAGHALSLGYQFLSDLFPLNPQTGLAWTVAEINALGCGYVALS